MESHATSQGSPCNRFRWHAVPERWDVPAVHPASASACRHSSAPRLKGAAVRCQPRGSGLRQPLFPGCTGSRLPLAGSGFETLTAPGGQRDPVSATPHERGVPAPRSEPRGFLAKLRRISPRIPSLSAGRRCFSPDERCSLPAPAAVSASVFAVFPIGKQASLRPSPDAPLL